MGITKAADKCDACYKSEDCVLTVTMREPCKGPFADRKEHVLALREYLLLGSMLRRECWRRAACPVCGKEYLHLVQYKPETCQEIECIHELRRRKGGVENEDNGGM